MLAKQKLIEIVGAENFTDQLEELVPYSYDASMNVHRPDAAVWPESTEQVSEIVKFANEHKIPVVPRGAGTSLIHSAGGGKDQRPGEISGSIIQHPWGIGRHDLCFGTGLKIDVVVANCDITDCFQVRTVCQEGFVNSVRQGDQGPLLVSEPNG